VEDVPQEQKALYQGKKTQAGALKQMVRKGRAVQASERERRERNRRMYRVGHAGVGAPVEQVRNTTRDVDIRRGTGSYPSVNQVKKIVNTRVALLMSKKPSLRNILTAKRDLQSIEGARIAGTFLEYFWDEQRIQDELRDLMRHGETDGVSVLSCIWDRNAGPFEDIPLDPNGEPITDPAELQGWRQAGMVQYERMRLGDVRVRAHRAGQFAFDPAMVTHMDEARWAIMSRIVPKDEVESYLGAEWDELVNQQKMMDGMSGNPTPDTDTRELAQAMRGSGEMTGRLDNTSKHNDDEVVVHELFAMPHGDWPQGAHVCWADAIPDLPWIEEPWDQELPFYVFAPRRDGGHLLTSMGTVDELISLQISMDRKRVGRDLYADLVVNPPANVARGSLRNPDIFNKKRVNEYHPGMPPPQFMQVPSEPTYLMRDAMNEELQTAERLGDVSAVAMGVAPGQGADSAAQYQQLLQQVEVNLSEVHERMKHAMEWLGACILKLVQEYYIMPRKIDLPGIEDTGDLTAFEGSMIRGAVRFKIDGDLLPKSRAAQTQTVFALAQIPGMVEEMRPYLGDLIEGDPEAFLKQRDQHKEFADQETQRFIDLSRNPLVQQQIWPEFQVMRQIYMGLLSEITEFIMEQQGQGMPVQVGPEEFLAAYGVEEPNLTQMCAQAAMDRPELDVPATKREHDDSIHVMQHDNYRNTQAYLVMSKQWPWLEQLLTEHVQAHDEAIAAQVQARQMMMAGPTQGSEPKELGEASQPAPASQPQEIGDGA
jgi:hypothetical protein